MNVMIVNSKDLGDRWDPVFHFVAREFAERTEALKAAHPASPGIPIPPAIAEALAKIPEETKRRVLVPLSRWNFKGTDAITSKNVEAVEKEYPHLALALLESVAGLEADAIDARIAELRKKADDLRSIAVTAHKSKGVDFKTMAAEMTPERLSIQVDHPPPSRFRP